MAKNLFFAGKMLSQDADSQVTNALAPEGGILDGALLVLGDLAEDDTYEAHGIEYDVYEAAAPEAATDEVVIADYAGISGGDIYDNYYKIGVKLFGLKAPEGELVRVRRLHLHDKFWLGEANFVAAPTVGEFAVATASSQLHTAASELPEAGYAIKILKEEDLTTGMESNGSKFLCEVVQL